MKKLYPFLILAFIFFACPTYDSLPETELLVEDVEFSKAEYRSPNSIYLEFSQPAAYDGIFSFYNKKEFSMSYYLKGGPDIKKTELEPSGTTSTITGIVITLAQGSAVPEKLVFDTKTPMYFYKTKSWNNIIEAKAFISTAERIVTGRP